MNAALRCWSLALAASWSLAGLLPAQLRVAVARADHVVLARALPREEAGGAHRLQHYALVETLAGSLPAEFSLIAPADVAETAELRLLCLVDADDQHGSAVVAACRGSGAVTACEGRDGEAAIELARVLLRSVAGRASLATAADLARIASRAPSAIALEAGLALRERPVLRDSLSRIARDRLLLRAVGASDVDLKIGLASLCAEAGHDGVIEALCVGLQTEGDPRLAAAVGHLTAELHGERALAVLRPFLRQALGDARERVLIAIGATGGDAALRLLLGMRERENPPQALEAALRAHDKAAAAAGLTGPVGVVEADRRG